jgi:hypothetical protein
VSFKIPAGIPSETMERLMNDLAAGRYGAAVRAKALAATDRGPRRFDLAFGNLSSAPFAQPIDDGRMVVIGTDLDSEAISRQLPAGRTSGA